MSFTSAEFSADLFALANDKTFDWKLTTIPHSEKVAFSTTDSAISAAGSTFTGKITAKKYASNDAVPDHKYSDETADDCVPNAYPGAKEGDPDLNAMEQASIAVEGFKLVNPTGSTSDTTATITNGRFEVTAGTDAATSKNEYTIKVMLNKDDYDQLKTPDNKIMIEVYWEEYEWTKAVRIDNKRSAIGELVAKYPVYSAGDEQQAGGIKGYVLVRIFRCRATTMPGFDSSYKSAVSNQVTFSTLESNQKDGATYTIAFYDDTMVTKANELHTA